MAIDTDNNQDSPLPVPEGPDAAPSSPRRSDRKGKQAAKASRRPGRPPKNVAPLTVPAAATQGEKAPARRGRPPKNAAPAAPEVQRRKPGRPPKNRVSEVPPPPPLVPVPPPPPGALEEIEVETVLAPPPPLVPEVLPEPETVEVAEEAPPAPVKRGPGRPRKVVVPEVSAPPAVAAPAPAPVQPALVALGALNPQAEPAGRLGEMGTHAVGFFRALFNFGAASEQAKPPEIEVLTTKEVARIVQAKESEVITAITSGQLRAVAIGKGYRTTPANVKRWLEG